MSKPLVIELYAGLFGWGTGFVAEGYRSVGFDLYKMGPVPEGCELVRQDVRTLHGSQFKDASVIVGSSPCQEFSWRAMPWKESKAQVPDILPEWWSISEKEMTPQQMGEWDEWKSENPVDPPLLGIELFQAQFRIQKEACEAAGRYIPMVVENVRGAQPWVGRAAWHYGSYYLWGDVPALMPFSSGRKVVMQSWSDYGKPGYKGVAFNDQAVRQMRDGVKMPENGSSPRWDERKIVRLNQVTTHEDGYSVAVESMAPHFMTPAEKEQLTDGTKHGSHSAARKAASAQIAKIPFELARHIAATFKP